MSSVSPGGADLVPTTPDWPAWVGFMVTTHFDLVSGPFHSPIFIGLHSVSTSANMYHLHTRAGELPRSASSHFFRFEKCDKFVHSVFWKHEASVLRCGASKRGLNGGAVLGRLPGRSSIPQAQRAHSL